MNLKMNQNTKDYILFRGKSLFVEEDQWSDHIGTLILGVDFGKPF